MSTQHPNLRLKLIECVELEPCIWNTKSDDFKRKDYKDDAWNRIVKEMQCYGFTLDLDTAARIWKNLKDTYKRRKNPSTGSASTRDWIYQEAMSFLDTADYTGYVAATLATPSQRSLITSLSQRFLSDHFSPTISNVDERGILSAPLLDDPPREFGCGDAPRARLLGRI
ncbi:hypothetical protein OSTOST_22516 [Ostertagia ostertagi]